MLVGIPEVNCKENRGEAVFGQNMAENVPEPVKDTNLQMQIPVNPNQGR